MSLFECLVPMCGDGEDKDVLGFDYERRIRAMHEVREISDDFFRAWVLTKEEDVVDPQKFMMFRPNRPEDILAVLWDDFSRHPESVYVIDLDNVILVTYMRMIQEAAFQRGIESSLSPRNYLDTSSKVQLITGNWAAWLKNTDSVVITASTKSKSEAQALLNRGKKGTERLGANDWGYMEGAQEGEKQNLLEEWLEGRQAKRVVVVDDTFNNLIGFMGYFPVRLVLYDFYNTRLSRLQDPPVEIMTEYSVVDGLYTYKYVLSSQATLDIVYYGTNALHNILSDADIIQCFEMANRAYKTDKASIYMVQWMVLWLYCLAQQPTAEALDGGLFMLLQVFDVTVAMYSEGYWRLENTQRDFELTRKKSGNVKVGYWIYTRGKRDRTVHSTDKRFSYSFDIGRGYKNLLVYPEDYANKLS